MGRAKTFHDILEGILGKQAISSSPITMTSYEVPCFIDLNLGFSSSLKARAVSSYRLFPRVRPTPKKPSLSIKKIATAQLTPREKQAALAFFGNSFGEWLVETDVRRRYRQGVFELHPDRTAGRTEEFLELQRHYQSLKKAFARLENTPLSAPACDI